MMESYNLALDTFLSLGIKQKMARFDLLTPFNLIKKLDFRPNNNFGSPGQTRTDNLEVNSFLLHH